MWFLTCYWRTTRKSIGWLNLAVGKLQFLKTVSQTTQLFIQNGCENTSTVQSMNCGLIMNYGLIMRRPLYLFAHSSQRGLLPVCQMSLHTFCSLSGTLFSLILWFPFYVLSRNHNLSFTSLISRCIWLISVSPHWIISFMKAETVTILPPLFFSYRDFWHILKIQ